jgi:glycine cleavage system H protein
LTDAPEEVNKDAYAAWFFKLKPADGGAFAGLLAPKAYEAVIGDE